MKDNTRHLETVEDSPHPLLLFDGVCNFCNGWVKWVLPRDKRGLYRFAALQSDTGRQRLESLGMDTTDFDSVVLLQNGRVFLRSDVALEVFRGLGGGWRLLYLFKLVPRPIRDAVYDWIARNRYRWWGKREECMLPQKEWKERFLG